METATTFTPIHLVGAVCVALFLSEAAQLVVKSLTKCEKGTTKKMWKFHHTGNVFMLVDHMVGETLFASREVGIGFSFDHQRSGGIKFTVHVYDTPDRVEAWASALRKSYCQNGLEDLALRVHTISSNNWNVDELNQILNTAGTLEGILKKKGIVLGRS